MPYISFQPKDNFKTTLYTGNETARTITVGMQPDLVFTKSRYDAHYGIITDSVTGAGKRMTTATLNAQDTTGASVASFISTGYTLTDNSTINGNSDTNVSWSWKAGTTSGISAGSQTITPSAYSINPAAGFGIYKWSRTGASTTDYFSHGLGVTPQVAIQKRTDGAQDWYVNTTVIDGTNDNLHLNKTDVKEDDSTTVPTSTNYYPKSPETGDYITYLFASIKGFSKCGVYYGNSSNDGPFVWCGFKPSMIMLKETGSTSAWFIIDNARSGNGGNPNNKFLRPNTSDAETDSSWHKIDFLSNGFKLQDDDTDINDSSYNYFYMAFAEHPLVSSNGVPATAK